MQSKGMQGGEDMKKKVAVISAGVVLLLMFAGLGIWVLFRQSANEIEYAEDKNPFVL